MTNLNKDRRQNNIVLVMMILFLIPFCVMGVVAMLFAIFLMVVVVFIVSMLLFVLFVLFIDVSSGFRFLFLRMSFIVGTVVEASLLFVSGVS